MADRKDDTLTPKSSATGEADRRRRQAEALRRNLRRRKDQARRDDTARSTPDDPRKRG